MRLKHKDTDGGLDTRTFLLILRTLALYMVIDLISAHNPCDGLNEELHMNEDNQTPVRGASQAPISRAARSIWARPLATVAALTIGAALTVGVASATTTPTAGSGGGHESGQASTQQSEAPDQSEASGSETSSPTDTQAAGDQQGEATGDQSDASDQSEASGSETSSPTDTQAAGDQQGEATGDHSD